MRSVHQLVALLALLSTVGSSFAGAQPAAPSRPLPTIVVETIYPGANAIDVAEKVAAPIEKQVKGVAGMLHMHSRCINDGRYVLSVTFKEGVDIDKAHALVLNRVELSLPTLPEAVTRAGVTQRKSTEVLLFIAVSSPGGKHGLPSLSDYATKQVVDEVNRVAGVADVKMIGSGDSGVRVHLDPQKLAALNLTVKDVMSALRQQNVQFAGGTIGQPPVIPGKSFQLDLKTIGRLPDVEALGNIVIKTGNPKAALVRLCNVARIEREGHATRGAFLNKKEVVALAVYPIAGAQPQEVSKAVRLKLAQLRNGAPKDLAMDVAMSFAPGEAKNVEHCRIDVDLPDGASVERTEAVLQKCEPLVRKIDGVQDVLALTDPDVQHRGQLLVSLAGGATAAARAKQITGLRKLLCKEVPEAVTRVIGPSAARSGPPDYPVQFAVCGATDKGFAALWSQADALAQRLAKTDKLIDVWANRNFTDEPYIEILIHLNKLKDQGVAAADLMNVLEKHFGSCYVNDELGQTWRVIVPANAHEKDKGEKKKLRIEDVNRLMVPNRDGKMISLAKITSSRVAFAPWVIERYDMEPMIAITANLAPGISPAEARTLCEKLATKVLPDGYQLKWF